jgi:hypothetical protein
MIHEIQALIVELVRRLIDEGVVLGLELVPQIARAAATERRGDGQQADREPELTPQSVASRTGFGIA